MIKETTANKPQSNCNHSKMNVNVNKCSPFWGFLTTVDQLARQKKPAPYPVASPGSNAMFFDKV